jgi:hypothetical protein
MMRFSLASCSKYSGPSVSDREHCYATGGIRDENPFQLNFEGDFILQLM